MNSLSLLEHSLIGLSLILAALGLLLVFEACSAKAQRSCTPQQTAAEWAARRTC